MPNDLVFCTRGEAAPRQTPTGFHIGSPEQAARSDAPLRVKGRYKIKSRIGADFAAKHAKSVTMQENPILSVETIAHCHVFCEKRAEPLDETPQGFDIPARGRIRRSRMTPRENASIKFAEP